MKLYLDGWGARIEDLTMDDVKALRRMIKGARLPERRDFDNLKRQIDNLEKHGLM